MGIPIFNAADVTLDQNTGTLPNMGDALLNWFQPMTFSVVTKTVSGFDVVETKADVSFQGVWQPLSANQLQLKPEGQRSWQWFRVHASPGLSLINDDVVTYQGIQYRVMAKYDFLIYGFNEYHLVNDYTGSGPA